MNWLIFLRFILFIWAGTFSALAFSQSIAEKIGELQKHADTYYWLSLERNNELVDVNKSITYLKKAQELIKEEKNSETKERLEFQIKIALNEAETQLGKYENQLNNYSPIFDQLLNKDSVLTFSNITEILAAKKSAVNLFSALPSIYKNESTLFTLVLIDEKFSSIEESIHDVITDNSSFYPVSKHELSRLLSPDEYQRLQLDPVPEKVLTKISTQLGDNKLGLIRVSQLDQTDQVSYWQSTFRLWGKPFGDVSTFYVNTGLSELINQSPHFVLFLMLLGFPYVFFVNWFFRKEKGSAVPQWFAASISAFSFILVYFTFEGLSVLGIDEQAFSTTIDGYSSIMLIIAVINLFPLAISYILISRVPQISALLNTPSAISTLIFGVFVGSYNYLGFLAAYRLGFESSLQIMILAFFVVWLLSLRLGISWSGYINTNKSKALIEVICYSVWLYVFTIFVFQWNLSTLLLVSGVVVFLSLLTKYVVHFSFWLCGKIISGNADILEDNIATSGLGWLSQKISEPIFFNSPWINKFNDAVDFFVEDEDELIEVLFIEADLGCGKTRTAKEVAESVRKKYQEKGTETIILFGSCEDDSDGAVITPYGPFAQAFSDYIGIGRFSDPTERAQKLQSGVLGTGLKMAMSATGTGALSSLIDSNIDDQQGARKTNTYEMAKVITETLVELGKQKQSKILFILDDSQWIDQESLDLFKLIIENISSDFNGNELAFIITSRLVTDDPIKNLLEEWDNNKLDLSTVINGDVLENEQIVKAMLQDFHFEFRSQQALISYFSELGIVRPLHVLQTLETLLKKQLIQPYGDRFNISDVDALKNLPPSRDYENMLRDLLGECDSRLLDVLQCCAIIGNEFRVSIVAEIFKIEILAFIALLQEAELAKILVDQGEQDDVYAFTDKRIRNGIKSFSKASGSGNNVLSQRIRIYHKRFIAIRESELEGLSQIPYESYLALAHHSYAVIDVYPEKATEYNRIAAEKTYDKGLTRKALELYQAALNAIELGHSKINLKTLLEFYISYSKCLLDAQKDPQDVLDILDKANLLIDKGSLKNTELNVSWFKNELIVIKALAYYRLRKFDDSLKEANKIISSKKASQVQQCRAMFYYAASLPPTDKKARQGAHLKVIENINLEIEGDKLSDIERVELLKVKSEALNNTGFIYLFGLRLPSESIVFFNEAIELNELPEINDQKGVGIANGGLGDAYMALGDFDLAEKSYNTNLNISTRDGDLQGICRMNSMLGEICLKREKDQAEPIASIFDSAFQYYEASLAAALEQKNSVGTIFALAGLIEVGLSSNRPEMFEYVFKEFDVLVEQELHQNIPEFATKIFKNSLENVRIKAPDLESKVDSCLRLLGLI